MTVLLVSIALLGVALTIVGWPLVLPLVTLGLVLSTTGRGA